MLQRSVSSDSINLNSTPSKIPSDGANALGPIAAGNPGIDSIVRNYLIASGYSKAAAELTKESAALRGARSNIVIGAVVGETGSLAADTAPAESGITAGNSNSVVQIKQEEPSSSSAAIVGRETVTLNLLSSVAEDVYLISLQKQRNMHEQDLGQEHVQQSVDTQRLDFIPPYAEEYDALRSWAMDSLDLAKSQLLALTFPILTHCYFGLVRHGHVDAAHAFVRRCRSHHSEFHADELNALLTVVAPEQLSSADFLEAAHRFLLCSQQNKFVVYMTSLAYQLLAMFLVQNESILVASIVNTKIQFRRLSDDAVVSDSAATFQQHAPAGAAEADGAADAAASVMVQLVELPGYSAGVKANTLLENFPAITCGVPGSSEIIQRLYADYLPACGIGSNRNASGSSLIIAGLTMPKARDDKLLKNVVEKLVAPQMAVASMRRFKRTRTGESVASISSRGASKEYDVNFAPEDIKSAAVAAAKLDSHKKKAASATSDACAALDPSIIFATVTNTYDGMTCMDVNTTVTQMVGGFRDSSIKVWRFDNNSRDGDGGDGERGGGPRNPFGMLLRNSSDYRWRFDEVYPKTYSSLRGNAAAADASADPVDGSGAAQSQGQQRFSSADKDESDVAMVQLHGHSRAVFGVSQMKSSSEGGHEFADRLILSCSADESIRLWDTAVLQCVGKYNCASPPWSVRFAPFGYHFASANQDATATVFATDRCTPLRLLKGHTSDVNCVTWHTNSLYLATGSDDTTVRLWDLRSARKVRAFRNACAPISCIDIAPTTGSLIAAGTENGTIHVWDISSSKPLAILQGHRGAVHSLSLSADGTALVSGGADCAVRVWDLADVYSEQTQHYISTAGNATAAAAMSSNRFNIGASTTCSIDMAQVVLRERHLFHTKFSSVFHVAYTPGNLICAGGPFNSTPLNPFVDGAGSAAAGAQIKNKFNSAEAASSVGGAGGHMKSSEQETVSALGIARPVLSYH